jgi:hypothetical protein
VQEQVLPEEVELSNRVVREWAGPRGELSGDDFLRVTFGDENGGQLYLGFGTVKTAPWWQHMKRVLREGKTMMADVEVGRSLPAGLDALLVTVMAALKQQHH